MSTTESTSSTPTVVLVHGAFADASSWTGVINELQAANVDVVAPSNPLRGVAKDAGYLTGFVKQLGGPAILVGHSYAGSVITQTGSDAKNVVGLVFVAAFAPEEGEKIGDINARYPDVALGGALRTFTYTMENAEQCTDLYVDPAKFREAFCADAPADAARAAAVTQRSASADAFTTVVTCEPAWKRLPSWAIVAKSDHAIHPDAERDMSKRAGSDTVEIEGAHAIMLSQPTAVADVILQAVKATS